MAPSIDLPGNALVAMGEVEGLARYEIPKKIGLLEDDFSIERGELTPTLKVKRRIIDKAYKPMIDTLYQDEREPATAGAGGKG